MVAFLSGELVKYIYIYKYHKINCKKNNCKLYIYFNCNSFSKPPYKPLCVYGVHRTNLQLVFVGRSSQNPAKNWLHRASRANHVVLSREGVPSSTKSNVEDTWCLKFFEIFGWGGTKCSSWYHPQSSIFFTKPPQEICCLSWAVISNASTSFKVLLGGSLWRPSIFRFSNTLFVGSAGETSTTHESPASSQPRL